MVFNANFFPCYNSFVVRKINEGVKVLGEHANIQV